MSKNRYRDWHNALLAPIMDGNLFKSCNRLTASPDEHDCEIQLFTFYLHSLSKSLFCAFLPFPALFLLLPWPLRCMFRVPCHVLYESVCGVYESKIFPIHLISFFITEASIFFIFWCDLPLPVSLCCVVWYILLFIFSNFCVYSLLYLYYFPFLLHSKLDQRSDFRKF